MRRRPIRRLLRGRGGGVLPITDVGLVNGDMPLDGVAFSPGIFTTGLTIMEGHRNIV